MVQVTAAVDLGVCDTRTHMAHMAACRFTEMHLSPGFITANCSSTSSERPVVFTVHIYFQHWLLYSMFSINPKWLIEHNMDKMNFEFASRLKSLIQDLKASKGNKK